MRPARHRPAPSPSVKIEAAFWRDKPAKGRSEPPLALAPAGPAENCAQRRRGGWIGAKMRRCFRLLPNRYRHVHAGTVRLKSYPSNSSKLSFCPIFGHSDRTIGILGCRDFLSEVLHRFIHHRRGYRSGRSAKPHSTNRIAPRPGLIATQKSSEARPPAGPAVSSRAAISAATLVTTCIKAPVCCVAKPRSTMWSRSARKPAQ